MGFNSNPPPPTASVPVVTESAETDTAAAYNQGNSRRKGLISSILTVRREQQPTAADANQTLG